MTRRPSESPIEAIRTLEKVREVLARTRGEDNAQPHPPPVAAEATAAAFDFATLDEYANLAMQKAAGEIAGIENPFYRLHDGRAADRTVLNGREVVNFSSYDYLGLNGHPSISKAAFDAIERFGTTVSASRLTAGERQIHRDLEAALARLHGCEDAVSFVSGHATNVSVIGGLLGDRDLIISDTLVHNSVIEGAKLSGAKRVQYPHGDLEAVERALRLHRTRHRRALIVVEGLYSMDGDLPDLAGLIKLKRRYDAWLMVDEAHSIGVLGDTGRGIAEEQGVDPQDVEIWMGTLSKAFVSTGGYIAGSRRLIELLKYTSPGFVYSVGGSPPATAAALAAIEVMAAEPWRLRKLRENGKAFLERARAHGLDVGPSAGASVVPIIVGSSPNTVRLSERLLARGFNVVPIIFPGVAENQARLRCFITSRHSLEQIDGVIEAIAAEMADIANAPSFISLVAGR